MKQILAILTLIASLTFTSCEDFLTEEVRGQQNLDTYFQSVEEAESFITGCYQAITFGGWWNINTYPKAPLYLSGKTGADQRRQLRLCETL